jgi:di/tricarboxylate transporter
MEHIIVFITLFITLILFVWGKWRYDIVALLSLLFLVIWGIIPGEDAFTGFGHPAVITVAAVLIISKALENSGLIHVLGRLMDIAGSNLYVQITVLCMLTAIASAFINNIGALAILMPVAIHIARKNGHPPSYFLMPVAFASLLGGMITLFGTPPNIIIATFRINYVGEAFGMFDFAPVGLSLTFAGVLFISLLGWRFLPKRVGKSSDNDLFEIENYITEVRVQKDSKINGLPCSEIIKEKDEDIMLLGLIRRGKRLHAPGRTEIVKNHDILILEADTDNLDSFIKRTGVKLAGKKKFRKDAEGSDEIETREVVVMPESPLISRTANSMNLRSRYGVNLLAVARREKKIRQRLEDVRFSNGDVLLLQGRSLNIDEIINNMKCLPLVKRDIKIGRPQQIILGLTIFAAAILTVITGILPVEIAFTAGAILMVILKILPAKDAYHHIDWPVIILLGAMIPVGIAFETSGGADIIANQIISISSEFPIWFIVGLILLITMFLSDLINNAATVVLMAPVGFTIATDLNISPDPILMAIAVGASCAFLTPIGHQSNALVMGPGGYKFSDYWRMGLPLEIIILLAGTPLILFFWPP